MRIKKFYIFILLIFLLLIGFFTIYKNPDGSKKNIDTPYVFPDNLNQANNNLNIPDETLKNLTTDALITTCLNYPLLNNILVFDNIQLGFNDMVNNFNGLKELLGREDSPQKIFEKYVLLSEDKYQEINTNPTLMPPKRMLGLILSQDSIFNKLTENEKEILCEKNKKTNNKQNYTFDPIILCNNY